MHRIISIILLALLVEAPALNSKYTFVTQDEIVGYGDFDGDSTSDTVVLHKQSGQLLIGYGTAGGGLSWSQPIPTGVAPASALATGPFQDPAADQIAVTGPTANRVVVIDPRSNFIRPAIVTTLGVGAESLAAIEFSGLPGNSSTYRDLYAISGKNNAPNSHWQHLLQAVSTGVSDASATPTIVGRTRPSRGRLLNASPERLVVLDPSSGNEILRVYDAASYPGGASLTSATLPGSGYDFTHAGFLANALNRNQYLCWQRGSDTVRIVRTNTSGAFLAPLVRPLGIGAIDSVFVVESSGPATFLVIAENGTQAVLFAVDNGVGVNDVTTISAPAGQRFSSAASYRSGDFALLSGPVSGGASNRSDRFTHDGVNWNPNGFVSLPSLLPSSSQSTLFLFNGEPIVDAGASLKEIVHVPDWTTSFSVNGTGTITVGREFFISPAGGLGGSASLVSAGYSGVTHALTNQPRVDVSVANGGTPLGVMPPDVRIDPPGGSYSTYVEPVVSSSAEAYYRTSSTSPWTLSTGGPISLPGGTLSDVTVEYFAKNPATNLQSPIYSATYHYEGYIDSDGDGVPDFVELARGISDPTAGEDTDGDGYSDLLEVMNETDAEDPNDHPSAGDRLKSAGAFDLTVVPLSHNTAQPGVSDRFCDRDTNLRVFGGDGSMLAQATSAAPSITSVTLGNIPASPRDGFVVVASDTNFDVLQGGLIVVPEGRELIGLVPVPNASFEPFEFVSAGGGMNQQAAEWIGQASAFYQSPQQAQVSENLTLEDTLHLLLVERLLALKLAGRVNGYDPDTATLTPHRDPQLTLIPQDSLLDLQEYRSPSDRGVLLHQLYDFVANSSLTAVVRLRQLANEIYRISADKGSDNPGLYPNPVTTLRDIIREAPLVTGTGTGPDLPGQNNSYESEVSLSPAQLLQANNAVASLLATMPQRSTISFTALVSSDSFENAVPVVQRETGNQLFAEALYDSAGDPFRFPAEFDLPLGTRLQILAFSDRQNVLLPVNGARGLEVISAEVVSYPNPPATDLDGNVLDDAFETFFLGSTGADPFADSDGDGYTNLQESLEGTNPSSDASFPATAAFAASPPTIDITPGVPGTFDLTVFFPTEYADQIKFTLERSSTLNAFNPSLLEEAVSAGSGEYSLTVSAPGDLEYFYRFRMSLR